MKNIYFLILMIFALNLYGQTDSIEKATFYKLFISKEISQEEFSDIGIKWNKAIKKIQGYPDLPLDQNGEVYYSFLIEFKNKNKEFLFNRSLEWLAIRHTIFPTYLYSNANDGKIIYSNSLKIDTNYSSNFTCIITLKDEKMLVEYFNIEYQGFFEGHYSGDNWVPDKNVNFKINQVFPVILKKPAEWDFNLKLLKGLNDFINADVNSLNDYILNYDSLIRF